MTGATFDCEIQARFRDINVGGHVDNVEAVRVIDEARIQFFMFAEVHGEGSAPGLLHRKPAGIVDLMGAQRVDYHAEMRFVPFAPFLVRMWICHVGRTSFTVATEMRVAADHPPALVAQSTFVFWDRSTGASWPINDEVRADLEAFIGPEVGLRG
ncbi:acyl-CoA thioester hydrolase [Marmoricola sp. OAE513]|uniref:acyl-CoA thioesterase n=1 Tax=Marmoricola sp. OAE513 TaxID=2817894 RepID=UPI001AE1499E